MGRIVRPADFQRVLGTPPRARSRHFALHHLAQAPSRPSRAAPAVPGSSTELSTAGEQVFPHAVEDLRLVAPPVPPLVPPPAPALTGRWLGMVVPKRHAKRSVTRSLIKRQIRNAVAESVRLAQAEPGADANDAAQGLAPGLWVVRLRAPIDRSQFPSAASEALRRRLHDELRTVVAQAARRHG